MEIIFYITCILSLLIGIKVDQWETISLLGFKMETPELFVKNSSVYHNFSAFLFIISIILLFLFKEEIGILKGIVILFIVFISSGWIGHKLAYKNYRSVIKEMLEFSESDEEKKELEESLNKSDSELLDHVVNQMKFNYGKRNKK